MKSYDEPVVAFEGKFEDPEITTFVELSTSPKLVEMDQYVHCSCYFLSKPPLKFPHLDAQHQADCLQNALCLSAPLLLPINSHASQQAKR